MNPFEIELIKTYAACDMSKSLTGKQLFIHVNTVQYHFDKIKKETGLDPRRFNNLVELLLRIEKGNTDETDAEI
jgi:sugar diacid utilization regulator